MAAGSVQESAGSVQEAAFSAESGQESTVTRLIKAAVRAGRDRSFSAALDETERLYLEELCRTQDMQEGLQAFLEKRPPVWKHR